MARYVFYSFHYDKDCFRAQQVRNIGAVTGNRVANANEWEQVKRGGDSAIKKWIDSELNGTSCLVVLIGEQTCIRPWCLYEIRRAWDLKKGVLGVHIHGLKNADGQTSSKGGDPILQPSALGLTGFQVPVRDPSGWDSKQVYASISSGLSSWIDDAIAHRKKFE